MLNPKENEDPREMPRTSRDAPQPSPMSVWRNFFLGNEPAIGRGPFSRMDIKRAKIITHEELSRIGIDLRDPNQMARYRVERARPWYSTRRLFRRQVLILDEPTSALGVRQLGVVSKYVLRAPEQGEGVVFMTQNPRHAFPAGDRFAMLRRGLGLGRSMLYPHGDDAEAAVGVAARLVSVQAHECGRS